MKYIKPQIKAPRVAPLESASTYAPAGAYVSMHCGGHDADERRFVNFNIQHSPGVFPGNYLIKSPQSTQRSQSSTIHAKWYEEVPPSKRGTLMTRIGRIFTDPWASVSSAQSVFYCIPSAFVSVHSRLFFYTDEATRRK
ncbi:MAG: hypothetical protein J5U17_09605 [Candidatus Methanoperedens sp.]|nr:hypothetical protein [Candidatus Methanoperedens sp.]MCE8428087.1 hypothetical protein [Candidatus Methanoperedens sp.]